MTLVIFVGPSLAGDHPSDVEVRPPVKRGDIFDVLHDRPSAIGLVDGSVSEHTTLWPKEILAALARGVRVVAGGTLGALFAAQLEAFGVEGVGEVFEALHDGRVRGLEEILPVDRPGEDGRLLRVGRPLVDLLDLIERGKRARLIGSAAGEQIASVARRLAPDARSHTTLFELAVRDGVDMGAIDALDALRRTTPLWATERDARAVVERLRAPASPVERRFDPAAVPDTIALDRLRASSHLSRVDPSVRIPIEAYEHPERGSHLDQITRGGEALKAIRKKVLLRILAVREVERLGIGVTKAEAQAMGDDFRRAFGLGLRADFEAWLSSERMTLAEFSSIMWELAAVRVCERWHARAIDRAIPGHISINAALDWTTKKKSDQD